MKKIILLLLIFIKFSCFAADYNIDISKGTITATPRTRSGLKKIQSKDAYYVIQNAINNLMADREGVLGGDIYISSGNYQLSNELVLAGKGDTFNPTTQIKISGAGNATSLIQNTPGKYGIIVKNAASVILEDFMVYTGVNSKSCVYGASDGAQFDRSFMNSSIKNLQLVSNSSAYPAIHLKNFFYLSINKLSASNSNFDCMVVENDSKAENFGNSDWGLLWLYAGPKHAGIKFVSTYAYKFMNMISIAHIECHSGYYGLFASALQNSIIGFIDSEGIDRPIYFAGSEKEGHVSAVKVLNGYLLVNGKNPAITANEYTKSNDITAVVSSLGTGVPLIDESMWRYPNKYRLTLEGGTEAMKNIKVKNRITEVDILTPDSDLIFRDILKVK